MITLIGEGKALDKIQTYLFITLRKLEIEANFLNLIMNIQKQTKVLELT